MLVDRTHETSYVFSNASSVAEHGKDTMKTLIALLFTALAVQAEIVELPVLQDAYICDCKPDSTNPNGNDTHLYFGRYFSCLDRTLIEWDLSMIPSEAYVVNAEMRLYCISFFGSASGQPVFHMINEEWNEFAVTLNTQPSFDATPCLSEDWPSAQSWFCVDVTPFVQAWVSGTHPNYGIYCTSTGTTGSCAPGFWSGDSGEEGLMPILVVTFDPLSLMGGSWGGIKSALN